MTIVETGVTTVYLHRCSPQCIKNKINNQIKNNKMIIKKEGTVSFWIDKKENPLAFTKGANIIWGIFEINGEKAIITTESNTLSVTMNPQTRNELVIFQTEIDSTGKSHNVAVTWSPESVCLYFDGVLIQKLLTPDL